MSNCPHESPWAINAGDIQRRVGLLRPVPPHSRPRSACHQIRHRALFSGAPRAAKVSNRFLAASKQPRAISPIAQTVPKRSRVATAP